MSWVKNMPMILLHSSQLSHSVWSITTWSMALITSLARGSALTTRPETRREAMTSGDFMTELNDEES